MAVDERVQSLYNALKADGADVGTVEEFNEWFFKPGEEGYNNRKYVYDTFKADGADVGKDYNEFASWLNLAPVDKSQPGTTAPNAVQQQDAAAGSNATGSVGKLGSSALGGAVGAIQAGSAINGALQAGAIGGAIGALQAGGQQNGVATGVVPASKTQQTELPKQEEGQLSPKSQPRQAELSEKEIEENLAFMREANKSRGDISDAAPQVQSNTGYSIPKMDKAWKLGYSQSWGKIKGLFDGLGYEKKDVTADLDDAVKSRYDSMSDQAIESELQKLSKEYKAGQWEGDEDVLRALISRLQFNLVAHEYGFKDFKDLLSRRGEAEFEMYKYHPAFEQEWLATYKGGPGENPLLNWGKEIVKKQLIEDTMNGVNRPAGYYHSLPFSNEEFSKRYASWALKRAKVLGNMGFADVYNNGIKTWESYIGAGLLESGAEEAMAQGAGYRDVGVAGGKYNSDFDAAAATAWNMAEDEFHRLTDTHNAEIWGNYAKSGGGRESRMMFSGEWAVSNMADDLTSHDLDKMIDNAWNALGETKRKQIMLATSQNLMKQYPGIDPAKAVKAAQAMVRQQTIQRVLDYAKKQNAPKNVIDYFARKVVSQNSIIKIQEAVARSRAGSTGDWQVREQAMQEYGKNHRIAGVTGTVVGMGLDPVTYISAGVGKGAATGAVKLVENIGAAAGRKWLTTTAGKVTVGAIGGAANLGTYEGINEALSQLRWGGAQAVDLNTGLIKTTGYDVGKIGKAIFHGSTMGAGTGIVAPLMGNVWSPIMEATSSTAGKMAVKTGELFTGTIAEGTIFSIPDVYDAYAESEDIIKSFSDKKSRNYISDDQERAKAIAKVREKRNETMLDIWNESVATMAGFKAKHIAERLYEVSKSGNGRVGFETRLRYMLDRKPDLALTKDEQAELERGGYTDLKGLVDDYVKAEKNRRANSKPVVTGRPRTMELGTREEDMPYNRFVDLMNDGSISEAARAKMYYYITGHALPMSTVMYGQLTENKDRDGNVKGYTVQSIGANGVVTSREFTSRKRAENELQKVNRQIELNTIDIGERYNENFGDAKRMEQACKNAAKEAAGGGTNFRFGENSTLWIRYYDIMRKKPEEMSAEERGIAQKIRDAYDKLGDEFEYEEYIYETNRNIFGINAELVVSAKKLRENIGQKYGVDVEKALKKEPKRRSNGEQMALDEYMRRLFPEKEAREEDAEDVTFSEDTSVTDETTNGFTDEATDEGEAIVEETLNRTGEDGMVHPAVLKGEDESQVNIVSGNVVTLADGTIDVANSDQDIIIVDAKGQRLMININDIASIGTPIDPNAAMAAAEQANTGTANAAPGVPSGTGDTVVSQAANTAAVSTGAPGATQGSVTGIEVGGRYNVVDEQNTQHEVEVLRDNGNGTVEVRVDGAEDSMPMAKDQLAAMLGIDVVPTTPQTEQPPATTKPLQEPVEQPAPVATNDMKQADVDAGENGVSLRDKAAAYVDAYFPDVTGEEREGFIEQLVAQNDFENTIRYDKEDGVNLDRIAKYEQRIAELEKEHVAENVDEEPEELSTAVDKYRIADDADEKAIGMAGFTRDNIQATADYLNGKLGKREYLERLGFDKNVLAGVNDDKVDTWVDGVVNRASEFLTDEPVESDEVSGEYFYESGNTVNPVRYRQEVADMVGRLNQSNAKLLSEYEEKMNAAKDDSEADALGDELEEKLQLPPGAAVSWGWDGEKYHPTIDLATGAGNTVSFGYLQSLPTEYKIGDKIGFRYEDRAYNAEVTKTNANGKILEAKDVESGRVVVRNGKVLGSNEIIAESDKVDRTTATIMAARNGDKEAQDKLSSYGIDWEKKPVVRFVSQGEVDSILAGERFNGRFNDGRVDVTNQTTPTTAANSEYRITYKDELDWALNKRLRMKNKDLGDGWIMDGYSLDDVQTIERRNPDGSYTVVYDANATTPEPMPMREVGKGKNKTTEPDWLAVTPERGHDWLFNEIGLDSADANDIVNANLEAAKKGVEKASKQKPQKTTNPLVLQSERERIKGEQEAAQAVLDYWNKVKAIEADRQAQTAAERKAKDAEVAAQAQAEEQERQAAELAKQQEQAERGAGAVHPAIAEKWNNAPKIEGYKDEVVLANGERVPGTYYLVESGAVTPSHNASREFEKYEGFPVDENGNTINDRDYERDKDAQNITRSIADKYDSRALQTPVIVSKDGVVLSGNGRTMAGELAASNNTDGAYIEHLKNYGRKYGFSPEQVSSMQHPRAVFVPDADMPYTTETFAKFNAQEMKGQSKTEQAVKLGKVVDDATFNQIVRAINDHETLGDFYNNTRAATEAINALRNAGALNNMQYAEMFDGDAVSSTGRQIIENMLIGKAFEGNPDVIRQLTEIKSLRQSVVTALSEITTNKALGKDYSLENELAQAVDLAYKARKAGYKENERVSPYATQLNLFPFEDGETVADYNNVAVLELADLMNDKRPTLLKKKLQDYNQQSAESAAGQMDIFSGGVKEKKEIIKTVLNTLHNGETEETKRPEQRGPVADERGGETSLQENGAADKSSASPITPQAEPVATQPIADEKDRQNPTLFDEKSEKSLEEAKNEWENLCKPKEIVNFANDEAAQEKWVGEHLNEIVDKYIAANGNKLDPDEMRRSFAGMGYDGKNVEEYRVQEGIVVGIIYDKMLENAVASGNTSITLLTGVGGAGKSVATRKMKDELDKRGLVYDSAFNRYDKLDKAIKRAKELGMTDVQVIAVHNDALTAFGNTVNRGLQTGRFLALDYFLNDAFYNNQGKIAELQSKHPDVDIVCYDNSGNKGGDRPNGGRVSVEEATKWDYTVTDELLNNLLDIIENGLNERRFKPNEIAIIGRRLPDVARRIAEPSVHTTERIDRLGQRIRQESVGDLQPEAPREQPVVRRDRLGATVDSGRKGEPGEVETSKEDPDAPLSLADLQEIDEGTQAFNLFKEINTGDVFVNNNGLTATIEKKIDVPKKKQAAVRLRWTKTVENGQDGRGLEILDPMRLMRWINDNNMVKQGEAKPQESAKGEQPKSSKKSNGDYGSKNKGVSQDRYEELKKRMRDRLNGKSGDSGSVSEPGVGYGGAPRFDNELYSMGVEMAAYHIEAGARTFDDFAKRMIEDLGDVIRPYLKSFYNGARDLPEMSEWEPELTPYDEVRKFDVANFDKKTVDAMATADTVIKEQQAAKDAEAAAAKIKETRQSNKKAAEQQGSLFGDLFGDEQSSGRAIEQTSKAQSKREEQPVKKEQPKQDKDENVNLQAGSEEARRERRQPQQNEPLGESSRNEAERPDGRGMGGRSESHPGDTSSRSGGLSRPSESEQRIAEPAVKKNTHNNRVERGKDYAPKDVDARIEANIAAIELMQKLIDSGKKATAKDMAVLRKFSGWGGLGKAFNESGYSYNPTARRLRELLGDEAYEQAVMSRNSAYFTPARIIDTMWDIARAMGFTGGSMVEGSAGIGNIIGLMPTDLSERTNILAVEIDQTTGNILKLLYPDAQVMIQGFETTKIPNGSVDLSITNVPFVTGLRVMDTSGDKDLSQKFHDIHDFCIAKNVRKLREGGIGIFITSSGTLDNSQKLRNWLVGEGNADVVGAFRLNNTTFGGTGATSDIIVVKKRVNGQKSPHAIDVLRTTGVRNAVYKTGDTKKVNGKWVDETKPYSMEYNEYFVEHPEMMGGEMKFGFEQGDTYRPGSKALYPKRGINQNDRLAEFVKSIADKDWSNDVALTTQQTEQPKVYEELGEGIKEGSMLIDKNGDLCVASYGRAVPLDVNNNKVKGRTKQQCFKDYSAIKDAVQAVLEYQTNNSDDAGLKPLIANLNRVYDNFVKTYGHFHKNPAISFLRNDMDYSSIAALETMKESNDANGKRVQSFKKGDIFTKRVVEPETEPKPTNVKDGIITSIYKHGRIDIPYISEQLGKTPEAVKKEIINSGLGFENPLSREVEVSYEYLSGNVRDKLRQAQEQNENGEYDVNIKALEKVIPMNIPAHLIEFSLGSSWLDPKVYELYIKDRTDLDIPVRNIGGTWVIKEPYYTAKEKNRAMGVHSEKLDKTIMGHELIAAAMQNKTVRVTKSQKLRNGKTEILVDQEATQACAAKIDEIRQDFKDWAREKMQSDPELSQQVEEAYNEQFNNYVPKEIPDEFVPEHFSGATQNITLRPHQAKAAIRATTQPLMLAHEVGSGKSFTLITTAMEMRRLGTARKPMVVVQNATLAQFVADAKLLYPNAKILSLEDSDRNAEGRKAFYAKIKYNDWDMIVVPQSAFEMIPDSEERQMAFVKDKIQEKMQVLEQLREAGATNFETKQAEKEISKLEDELSMISSAKAAKRKEKDAKKEAIAKQNADVKAREMLDRKVDDVEDFDEMGIDAILVDEAHEYKHLGFATAMQRGVKGVDPSYSKKAQGVYLKTQSVMERTGGKNVVFATGTPISNTAAEVWTFMRYLMPADVMKSYDIYYFDDFVRNFGNLTQMLEFTTSGKFKENNRFAGYVNLPELVRIWFSVADTVRSSDVGSLMAKIPAMEGDKAQDIYLPQTPALRSVMKYVKARLREYDNMSGKEKKANSHIPLTMYGIAKAAAVDARLVMNDAPDDPNSKTNEAVRQTMRSLKETAKYKGTVAIFADNYQNKDSGFNIYEDIKKKLVAEGVPENQVVVIKSGMSIKKKQEIFDKVNAGDIRVIMGSTFTLGTGVNIQERLHTLIHLDAPNRPMDYTQRNGRILRQGNLHKEWGLPVRVLRFGVEDSLDVTAYQRLKTKGAIVESIMNGKQLMGNSMENRTMEEEEDAFGDTVAQLSGSEYAMLKQQAEREVRKLIAKKKQHEADQVYIHNQKPRLEGQIATAKKRMEQAKKSLELVKDVPENPVITINKVKYPSVDAMADYIKAYNKKVAEAADRVRNSYMDSSEKRDLTMNIGGFDFDVSTVITKDTERTGTTLSYVARRVMTYSCEALGLENVPVKQALLRNAIEDIITNVLTGKDFKERIESSERRITNNESEIKQLNSREGKPFEFDKELAEAEARLADYEEKMKAELEAKEAKYAEMDADIDEASSVDYTDEDGETVANEDAVPYGDVRRGSLAPQYQKYSIEEMGSGNVPFNGKVLSSGDKSKFKVIDDNAKVFKNWFGSEQKRYQGNVGKKMGNGIYLHKDYATEVIPEDVWNKAQAIADREGINYNTVYYEPKKRPKMVRFDEAPDFDTAREPITGNWVYVDTESGDINSRGQSKQIWHNKWMWVKDDYAGFDVEEAYEWSKRWNQLISNPDGWAYKWDYLLSQANLPIDWSGSALEDKGVVMDEPSVGYGNNISQSFGSAGTSISQTAGTIKRKIQWEPGTVNVDIGGGRFDKATNFLKEKGVENLVFDPFNRNAEHNKAVAERVRDEKVDTVTCTNVLNVIDNQAARANVILQAAKALKDGGTAYFSVYEGDKSGVGRQTQSDSWQNNRRTKDYVPEIEQYFEDVSLKNGVITARNPIPTDELSVWDFDGQYSGNGIAFERGSSYRNGNGDVIRFESHAEQMSLFGVEQSNNRAVEQSKRVETVKRAQEMSDAELLKEMGRDIAELEKAGRADWGVQTLYSDEYDRRHIKEYNQECDAVRRMLDENNVGIEEAEQMLLDTIFTWRDGFATPDRTKLLAQFDTLNSYYAEKEDERDNADLYQEVEVEQAETPTTPQEVALPAQQTEPAKPKKAGFNPADIKLRKLKGGETCYVERRYQESGGFDFTGSEVVKSDADLAYIFRNLENSAIENSFLVLIKDGKATILHTGMGNYGAAIGHTGAGMLAASQLKPQSVIMVHNHPSGNLVPSDKDIDLQKRTKRMFGENVVREAIIIDITSGEYSVFDTDNTRGTIKHRPTSAENEVDYKTYSFSKLVFNKGYRPGTTMQITDANKAAAFISSHRLGERDKLSLIVMDRRRHVTGNVFLPWTTLDDVDVTKAANKIATYIHQMGGESGIIYGSGTIDRSKLGPLSREIENHEVRLDDFINVEGVSAQVQGVMEPEVEYEAVPRNTEQPTEVAEDSVGYGDTDDSGISDEELATYDAGRYSFAESVTQGLVDLATKNANDYQLRINAMREFGGNLAKLRKIMDKQKAYDKATVDDIVRLARMVMGNGFFKNMSAYEVKRLLAAIKKGVGAENLTPIANNVVDMLVSHQLRESKAALAKLMQIKGRKVDARGIEVQAGLDIDGQRMMSALKDGMSLGENGLSTRINDCENRLDSQDEIVKKNAVSEYQGLMLAKDYHDNILSGEEEEILLREDKRREEEKIYDFRRDPVLDDDGNAIINLDGSVRTVERKTLKPEFKTNVTDENKRKRKDVEAAIEKIEQSIRENRMERVTAYSDFISDVVGDVRASRERAAAWRDEQLKRVEEIHHNANSDLQGIDPKSQTKEKKFVPIFNPKNDLVRGLFMPLATFEKFMRFFGRRFHNGEGYLFDRYVRGMIECSDKEWRSKRAAHDELDAKVTELFGKTKLGAKRHWSDLFELERKKKYPTIPVEYWDNGERVRESLSQGEALSLYVWSKQKDAEAGLRRMGISEEDMETLRGQLDPKFVELADWVVSDFLPKRREYYNEVYERMFGAPMAAIENYFPIVRNSRDVEKPTDVAERDMSTANASTITGSFIKRVRTAAALDIHTDFFSHLLKHLDDMEHIAAWAEFNRDLNTLRNYKRFKNRVSNMNSFEFGAGKDLWKAFDNCCAIVAGVYEGNAKSKLDKITLNINKGFTGGAIAFRFNTALKQLLSLPAFWSDASADQLLLYQTNPVGNFIAWKWAMQNLPGFSKRWQSRQVGDTRLMDTDMDWKLWRNKYMKYLSRGGMLANAFVDAVTVASGAKAVYETKKRRYKNIGYTDEQAERKALQDAAISYNGSQQSSESGFVSEMQVDRTFLNNMLTIFRNSPFSYGRKMTTGLRELKKRLRPGYKSDFIEAEATKMGREGIPEDNAKKAARRLYRFGGLHAMFDVFNYGYLLSFLWTVLGGSAWYLLFGKDDEKKKEIIKDGTRRLWFSPIEGFTGGNTLSEKGGLLLKYTSDEDGAEKALEDFVNWSWFTTPMEGETDNFLRDVRFDEQKAMWDVLSLAIQANLGFKPETFTDGVAAIVDYCDGDPQTSKEFLLCFMRVMQVPQSQTDNVYIDELGMTAKDAQKLNAMEMADRYAKYKRRKNDPLSYITHSEDEQNIYEKYRKRFLDNMKERMMKMDEEQLNWNFDNPNDSERRKAVGKVYSKQNDVKGSAWNKPAKNWKPETRRAHLKYQRYQTWEDLAEDTMLDLMIQQAENRGDNETAKALRDGKKKLTEIKHGKHTKTIDIYGLGEGSAEEDKAIMEKLRSARKELIKEYGGY